MGLRICSRGHLTGQRHCAGCGAAAIRDVPGRPAPRRISPLEKRRIDARIREAGGIPTSELRRRYGISGAIRSRRFA